MPSTHNVRDFHGALTGNRPNRAAMTRADFDGDCYEALRKIV